MEKRRTYDKIYCKKASSADSGSDDGITFLSFAMMHMAGGDAVTYMYENAGAAVSQEELMRQRKNMGWISRFLSSMRNGSQEWQPEIWE